MKLSRNQRSLAWLILIFISLGSAQAQVNPTGISGRVTTVDGAVFPGARIRVQNRVTKKSISTMTDENGEFFVQIPPATYDVFVEAASWKPARRKGLKVVQDVRLIVDFVLSPGKPVVVDGEHP